MPVKRVKRTLARQSVLTSKQAYCLAIQALQNAGVIIPHVKRGNRSCGRGGDEDVDWSRVQAALAVMQDDSERTRTQLRLVGLRIEHFPSGISHVQGMLINSNSTLENLVSQVNLAKSLVLAQNLDRIKVNSCWNSLVIRATSLKAHLRAVHKLLDDLNVGALFMQPGCALLPNEPHCNHPDSEKHAPRCSAVVKEASDWPVC